MEEIDYLEHHLQIEERLLHAAKVRKHIGRVAGHIRITSQDTGVRARAGEQIIRIKSHEKSEDILEL